MQAVWRRILCIRLWNKSYRVWDLDEELYRQYIGGSGVGLKILNDMTNENTEPLGAYNPIIWMTGALTATDKISSERYYVISRSPLSDKIVECGAGGPFGSALKKAGYDGLIVTGISDEPVSVMINNDEVQICCASEVWGEDTFDAERYFKQKYGEDSALACIGPAGEKILPIAGIASGPKNSRMSGRSGLGAVMGSKRLKAIIIKGDCEIKVANENKVLSQKKRLVRESENKLQREESDLKSHLNKNSEDRNYYCSSCFIECYRNPSNLFGKWGCNSSFGLEYEAMSLMGAICRVDDVSALEKVAELCNRHGIDVIDLATSISILMKSYEMGYLKESDLSGMKPIWGDASVFVELTEKICNYEGVGKLLGKGAAFAIRRLPGASMLGLPVKGLAVGYGRIHKIAGRDKDRYYKYFYDRLKKRSNYERARQSDKRVDISKEIDNLLNSMGICKFSAYGQGTLADLCICYEAITGSALTENELLEAASKIESLKK